MFRTAKPLIGTPREPQKSTQTFEFTPIGDENTDTRRGHKKHAQTATDVHISNLINKRNPLNNSPLANRLRGGSSFMDSEYDSIHNSATKQQRQSSSPVAGAFHANSTHHELLNNGSNPVRQQQEDISKLKSENYNLKVKVASLTKYLNAVTNQEQQYIYEENSRLQEQLIKLREEVSQLTRELSAKDQQPQHAQHTLPDNSDKYKEEIKKLTATIQDLEEFLQDQEQLKQTIKDLQELNQELQEEAEHQSEKARSSSPVSKKYVARLQGDMQDLQDQLDDREHDIRRRDEELDEKEDMIENLQAQIRELQQRSYHDTAAESQVGELKLLIKKRDEELDKTHKDMKSMEKEIHKLQDALHKAQGDSDELSKALHATKMKLQKVQDDMMNRSTGEHSSAEITRLKNVIADLEAQNDSLHSKFRESKSIISEQKQVLDELQDTESTLEDLKREKEHLKIKIDQLERENERTYKAYQDAKKMLQQSKVKTTNTGELWKTEIDLLTSKVNDLNVENEKLFNDLEKEKQTKTMDNDSYSKIELKSLTAKCNDLQLELADREHSLERLTSQYQKELDRYELIVQEKEKELSRTKNELRDLKMSTLQQLDDEKIEFIKVKGSKESQIKLLQIELDTLKEEHQMEINALKKVIQRLKKSATTTTADDLLDSVDTHDGSRELLKKITEKNNRIKFLNEKLTEALLTLKEAQSRINRIESHKSDLKDDNQRLEKQITEISQKLYDYKRDMQRMATSSVDKDDLDDLKLQLRLMEKENINTKNGRRELAEKYSVLSEENGLLQRRIEKIVDKYRQLQSSLNQSTSGSSRSLVNLQNKIDYYKMKHTKASYQVKDLKFMNSFMKMSIQATNTHLQSDIKKLQDVGIYPDYELICKKKPSLRVLLKFVLAAIRIKRKTEYSSIRNEKIELLEMKALV